MGTGPGTLILAIGVAVGGAAGAAFGALANEPPDGGGGGGGRGGEEASQSGGGAATMMTTIATAAVRRAPFAPLPLWASLVVCGSCYTVYVMPFFDTQMWCLRSDYTLSFRRVRSFFLSFFLFFSRSPTPANGCHVAFNAGSRSVGVNLNRCGAVSRCSFISWVQESNVSTTVELGASLALPLAAFVIDNHHGGRVLPSAAAASAASSSAWRGGPRAACLVGGVLMALGYGAALTALVSGRREWRPLLRVVAEPPEPDAPLHCHLHLSTRHRRAHRMADVTAVRRRAHGETRQTKQIRT